MNNAKDLRCRTALNPEEERQIIELVQRFSDKRVPLYRTHLSEAAATFIQTLPLERQKTLPFKNGKPGVRWVRNFYLRHSDELRYAISQQQERKRNLSINVETLAEHYSNLEELMAKHGLTAERVFNLDENGVSSGHDVKGKVCQPKFMRRGSTPDYVLPAFRYDNRMTVLSNFSASGEVGPLMFVMKGTRLPFREVLVDGQRYIETINSQLP